MKVIVTGIADTTSLRILIMSLKKSGCECVSLPNMDEALDHYKNGPQQFNAIITEHIAFDARRRNKEGMELATEIRGLPAESNPQIAIIMICNHAPSGTVRWAEQLAVTLSQAFQVSEHLVKMQPA